MAFNPSNLNWAALASLASGNTVGEQLGNANNVMAGQAEKAQALNAENATKAWLTKTFPGEDFSQFSGPALAQAFNYGLQRHAQAQQPKSAEFKQLDDGTYGAWDGKSFNVLGTAPKPADLPAIADEYNWMKAQGYKGTPQEYQAYKASLNKSGFMVEQGPDGFRVVQGDINSMPEKPLTESQSKDVNFLTRAQKAEADLAPVENELTNWSQKRADGLPMDMGNYMASPNYQKAQQAGREVLAVILRKDTGAAVTPQELDTYGKIYLPQPGDSKEVIEAKRKSRQTAIEAIRMGLPEAHQNDQMKTSPNTVVPYTDFFK